MIGVLGADAVRCTLRFAAGAIALAEALREVAGGCERGARVSLTVGAVGGSTRSTTGSGAASPCGPIVSFVEGESLTAVIGRAVGAVGCCTKTGPDALSDMTSLSIHPAAAMNAI